MGLFSFIKGQFIEVIEWTDDTGAIVHRFPAYDNAIKMGAQLIVRESQAAIFVNEGQLADVFAPGRYTLSTQNLPVLTALKSWKYAFNSPFKADVYFINTINFTDQKWGTTNPVIMRDKEFGLIRLRGFGNYSFKVKDPVLFLKDIFGTKQDFSTEQITGYLKTAVVSGVSDLLAESGIPVAELAVHYDELGNLAAERLNQRFAAIGLELTGFVIENISLPEEVEKMIDRRSSMSVAGNLDQYMKYQTAEAIREAANNPGDGLAGAGAGIGAGLAMGQMINRMMTNPEPASAAAAAPTTAGTETACGGCGHGLQAVDKFCPQCGKPRVEQRFCSQCGGRLAEQAKFCSACGAKQ